MVYFQAKYCRRKKWTLLSWERFMTTKISRNVRYSAKSRFLDQSTFLVLSLPSVKLILPPPPHFSNYPIFQTNVRSVPWKFERFGFQCTPMYILNNLFAVLFKTIQLNDVTVQMLLFIIRKHEPWRCTFHQCIYLPQCYHIESEEVNCDKFKFKSWFVTGVV